MHQQMKGEKEVALHETVSGCALNESVQNFFKNVLVL